MSDGDGITLKYIARVKSDFPDKFGIPRQSGLVDELCARVVFEPPYRNADAVRGLEDFSHIWLIWEFSAAPHDGGFSPTVRPPRLGGNRRMGVFATRSPFRPNPVGLSCVRLERVETDCAEGPVLHIRGADIMDGTPVLDIKPYLPYADCIPGASGGFAGSAPAQAAQVYIPDELICRVPEELRRSLAGVLGCDPRPSYHSDPERVYSMDFAGLTVRFRAENGRITVCGVLAREEKM